MMIWSEGNTAAVTVTVTDQAALLSDLAQRFRAGQGFSVATLNLDHVVKLSRDRGFLEAYQAQTHVTADGNPIVWLSRLARQYVSLVPGSGLIEPLVSLAVSHGIPVALLGSTEVALQASARELCLRHPGLDLVLCRAPAMGFDPAGREADAEIEALQVSGARLCFLAFGAPKQEVFAARAHAVLPSVGFVSVGAGLDFIAQTQIRAPAWVQAIAAEWLWRLVGNPKRFALRYGACFVALPGLTRKALRARWQVGSP